MSHFVSFQKKRSPSRVFEESEQIGNLSYWQILKGIQQLVWASSL
ncbi:hypothetical protein [Cyanobacterium sp. uoEpiScrs1]|nr:hypothetical protein [Cyanobacterium sp. uoEpiScrs1]